jgi:hypothetical protein
VTGNCEQPSLRGTVCWARSGLALTLKRVRDAAAALPDCSVPRSGLPGRSLDRSGPQRSARPRVELERSAALTSRPGPTNSTANHDGSVVHRSQAIPADMTNVAWVRRRALARAGYLPVNILYMNTCDEKQIWATSGCFPTWLTIKDSQQAHCSYLRVCSR